MDIITKENFAKAYPELYGEIVKEASEKGFSAGYDKGKADGAEAERKRIMDVEAQILPGHEDLIKALKYDGKTTGPDAAVQILAAEKKLMKVKLQDIIDDGSKAKVSDVDTSSSEKKTEVDPGIELDCLTKEKMKETGMDYRNASIAVQKEHLDLAQKVTEQLKAQRERK